MSTYIKIDRPAGLPGYGGGTFHYNEATGMEYNVHEVVDGMYYDVDSDRAVGVDCGDGVYLAACHDAVGIVTWYRVNDEAAMWRDIQDEEEGE
jgi:hypothetical protein